MTAARLLELVLPFGQGPVTGEPGKITWAVEQVLQRAVEARASDIHLEPRKDRLLVRFRVDGVMVDQSWMPESASQPLASRIKVPAKMDISERRRPQDGTFEFVLSSGQTLSARASTFPCYRGEKIVLRLLENREILPLGALGMSPAQIGTVRAMTEQSGGLILVTGPTGSGKTSTLYALLKELDIQERNVVTLEDPVELEIPGITQGQVHDRAGFTFAAGLRSILRQDPDVILVGEMRDLETTQIALQASLTGHLVLSTMHTNSAVATITRLLELGVEPYLVGNALVGVIAQRLVRRLCPDCGRQPTGSVEEFGGELISIDGSLLAPLVGDEADELALDEGPVAVGCERCLHSGYRGREGLYEIVPFDDELSRLVKEQADPSRLLEVLARNGVDTLREAGLKKAQLGLTTVREVERVT